MSRQRWARCKMWSGNVLSIGRHSDDTGLWWHLTTKRKTIRRGHVTQRGPAHLSVCLSGRVRPPELDVGEQEECGRDQQQSDLVAPQIPRSGVRDALLRQKLLASYAAQVYSNRNISNSMHWLRITDGVNWKLCLQGFTRPGAGVFVRTVHYDIQWRAPNVLNISTSCRPCSDSC